MNSKQLALVNKYIKQSPQDILIAVKILFLDHFHVNKESRDSYERIFGNTSFGRGTKDRGPWRFDDRVTLAWLIWRRFLGHYPTMPFLAYASIENIANVHLMDSTKILKDFFEKHREYLGLYYCKDIWQWVCTLGGIVSSAEREYSIKASLPDLYPSALFGYHFYWSYVGGKWIPISTCEKAMVVRFLTDYILSETVNKVRQ